MMAICSALSVSLVWSMQMASIQNFFFRHFERKPFRAMSADAVTLYSLPLSKIVELCSDEPQT